MHRFGKAVVRARIPILILSVLLLIPAVLGYANTRVNYDLLYYLPDDIETMQGQDILLDDFGKGAFAMFMVDGMEDKDVAKLKAEIEDVDHVAEVIWYDSLADISVPKEILPDQVGSVFNSEDGTLMAIFFDTTTSEDDTMTAIEDIRSIGGKQCFLSGMSAVVLDTKNLSEQETPVYVLIAVILSCIILGLFLDSFMLPVLFLLSIGMAILYNLGSNYFFGEISYVTKALSAVLQLGVTMDYSIFLWHSYEEQKERFPGERERAMAHAISNTISSVVGSSVTTVAGFLALCLMSFTLGRDLGLVMAKGVVFGVLACVTILPSMILVFDKAIEKTRHRALLPDFHGISTWITKHSKVFFVAFLIILVPALYGYTHSEVYYNLDETLPKELDSIEANTKLSETYEMNTVHMILADAKLEPKASKAMLREMQSVDGVKFALGMDSLIGSAVPQEAIPEGIQDTLKRGDWQLMLVSSEYKVASDAVNQQVNEINAVLDKYDSKAMLIGEAPCTKDLIDITDHDFKVVSAISIVAILLIILCVFRSPTLPVVLVAAIEFAIFINLGIPCYTDTKLPFIASIVIGTIQLGATVDYAILMTNRYRKERCVRGKTKQEAVQIALETSMQSIIVSALGFFAATGGVGLYSNIDMIRSLCALMARGAIISMFVVILVLPSFFLLFDRILIRKKEIAVPMEKGASL